MVTILNTSILTTFGAYNYRPTDVEGAKKLIANGFKSAVGHESTAQIISELLGVPVEVNRVMYVQEPYEYALVFKLKGRPEEGKILTKEEIEAIGYEFGVLYRNA